MRSMWLKSLAGLMVGVLMIGIGCKAQAEEKTLSIGMSALRTIQTYAQGEDKTDDVYLLINGVAGGKEFGARYPAEGKTFKAHPKKMPVTVKSPLSLWKGKLADGQFALITVTLIHGKGNKAKEAEFSKALVTALSAVKGRSAKTLDEKSYIALHDQSAAAATKFITGVKKILSRKLKTDHYGGQFSVLIWNNGGKISKRLTPVGLTNGEHFGIEKKIYSKLKYTRNNVLVEENGEWFEMQISPLPLDGTKNPVSVKLLETELIPVKGADEPVRNVADYLLDINVYDGDKPLDWMLDGEHPGPTILHDFWDFAK